MWSNLLTFIQNLCHFLAISALPIKTTLLGTLHLTVPICESHIKVNGFMVVVLSSSCSRAIMLTQFQAARSSSLFGGLIPKQPRWHPPPLGETDRWWEWFSSSPNWMGDVIRSYFLRLRLRFATDAFVSLFAPNRAMFCSIRNACRSTLSGNISKENSYWTYAYV